ncbi:PREDICTED: uncharacterized protein LOC109165363 [Ipomoea nil]|uniref:uncharacterized protein LOC109165363 n=1 Tax=Ipomoea nil TaxID=35883 RepID=UPI00090184C2|nr:PREDICTED: uncharacterized protein LOC109165363 [Ipomoea nil]
MGIDILILDDYLIRSSGSQQEICALLQPFDTFYQTMGRHRKKSVLCSNPFTPFIKHLEAMQFSILAGNTAADLTGEFASSFTLSSNISVVRSSNYSIMGVPDQISLSWLRSQDGIYLHPKGLWSFPLHPKKNTHT